MDLKECLEWISKFLSCFLEKGSGVKMDQLQKWGSFSSNLRNGKKRKTLNF